MRWLAYALLAAVQVAALAVGVRQVSVPAQCLLMPVLAVVALPLLPQGRRRIWAALALGASFLGDLLPQLVGEGLGLPLLLGSFAVAQLGWILTFRPGAERRSLLLAAVLAVPAVTLVVLCWPGAGTLAPAVVGYAGLLTAMAALAGSHGWRGLVGGTLFLCSDALIALNVFAPALRFDGIDVVVMATYATAQGLLAAAATSPRPERA